MKKIIAIPLVLIVVACNSGTRVYENETKGYAQGSTYQIKYLSESPLDFKDELDSIFKAIDQSMSTYLESSLISRINAGDTLVEVDQLFMEVLNRSNAVSAETDGLFDPTVGPLVELWGFGKSKNLNIDSALVDSALVLVNYKRVYVKDARVRVPEGFKIDFNSIAQGYTVDVIADYLEVHGLDSYMVEVGGEVKAKGKNKNGDYWRIGVDKPMDEIDPEDRFQIIVELQDKALATSGNYRKFWVDSVSGIKYAHTLNPKTGYPERNQLLSVSVIANRAMDADAYATACMVMGLERAKNFIAEKDEIEAYFISTDENGDWKISFTKGFEQYITAM